ncbi:MAG: right-handed parallel beta-helix repeat-containing protein [Bacteroidales bacterium]|nr:right-handed parallel beta-helix repeat-containing protein [Bacteroidales bacterium]
MKVKRFISTFSVLLFALNIAAQQSITVSPGEHSIEKALKKAKKVDGAVTIYLHEGRYELSKPIVFTATDKDLTIMSFPNEKALITGSKRLKLKWQPHRDGIYKATVPKKIFDGEIDILIVDGHIAQMARYPNYDSTAVRFNGTSADATSIERVTKWEKPQGGFLHAMHQSDWGDFHYRITGKKTDGTLELTGGHQNNRRMGIHRDNRMVEGIFEELDTQDEWFFDKDSHTLYYYPLAGRDIAKSTFEVAAQKSLVEIRGATNITIQDLELTGTARTFMEEYEPLLRSDWTVYRGGAIVMEGTEDCSIKNCHLHNLGGNGVFISRFNHDALVSSCHIENIGASAVLFVGDTSAVRSPSFEYNEFVPIDKMDFTHGPMNDNYPTHCTVADNLIHHIGLFEKQITGIELSMCSHITVSHNTIYDVPRAGINISEGTWGGHIIEHNDIFNTVKETGDHGSINSWGRDRYWHPDYRHMCEIAEQHPELILADAISPVTISHNRLRCDRGWDIDLDDGSSNYIIKDNLCLNGGIKLREGFYRTVENNILVNNTFHPHVWFKQSGDVFRHNVVMRPYQPINLQGWGAEVDYNVFTDSLSLIESQQYGIDSHSIVADIAFADFTKGNYKLYSQNEVNGDMPDTLTFFRNFDMDSFGVQSPKLKALAKLPQMSLPIVGSKISQQDVIIWNGWAVKNLETLGERSATGMDSEHGVYVISLMSYDSFLRDYLHPNDVIIAVNENIIESVEQLQKITKKLKTITVFRNQKKMTVNL